MELHLHVLLAEPPACRIDSTNRTIGRYEFQLALYGSDDALVLPMAHEVVMAFPPTSAPSA